MEYPADPSLPRLAESFASASLHGDPFLYPGERPESSYITNGTIVYGMRPDAADGKLSFEVASEDSVATLDEYLEARKVAAIENRIPILGYGANVSPGSLAKKFSKAGDSRQDLLIVPTAYAQLAAHDVVWSGGPGINGNFIAQLYNGPEVADTAVQVGVNFLTPEQLLMMHATELSYQLSSVEVELGGRAVQAYMYAGQDSVHLRDGRPVALASVPAANRNLEAATAEEMTTSMLEVSEIQQLLHERFPNAADAAIDARGYLALIKSLRISPQEKQPRLKLRQAIGGRLKELGLVQIVDTTESPDSEAACGPVIYSWANPSTLPTFGESQVPSRDVDQPVYRLPEMELPLQKWRHDPKTRAKILHGVSAHFERMQPNV